MANSTVFQEPLILIGYWSGEPGNDQRPVADYERDNASSIRVTVGRS
jgi:hypothetical protein